MAKKFTLVELCETLWDQAQKVVAGKQTAANCNAVTNAVGKILTATKAVIEYQKLTGKQIKLPMLEGPEEPKE